MKRPIAMIVAGVFTTAAVIAGTVAAVQTGVFASSTTTVQANGEINVPTAPPATEQSQAVIEVQPTDTQTATLALQPTDTVTDTTTPVVVSDNSGREAELMARLSEAYKVMQDRESAYQTKLREAYNKLAASQASGAAPGGGDNGGSSSQHSSSVSVPAPQVQPVVSGNGGHPEDQHKEDQHPQEQHPQEQHPSEQHTPEPHTQDQHSSGQPPKGSPGQDH